MNDVCLGPKYWLKNQVEKAVDPFNPGIVNAVGMLNQPFDGKWFLSSVEGRCAVRYRYLLTQFLLRDPDLRITEEKKIKRFLYK